VATSLAPIPGRSSGLSLVLVDVLVVVV